MEFGIIGKYLGHSFSKQYFTEKFEKLKLNHQFHAFELTEIENFLQLLKQYQNLRGLSVTIPYKESIIPFLNEIDESARCIGAVNSVKVYTEQNQLKTKGFNTDFLGFKNSIKPMLNANDKKALILGTGGASKAVAYAFEKLGIEFVFVSRTESSNCWSYSSLKGRMKQFQIIVNTTPVGMYPNVDELLELPYEELDHQHLLYDLIYNPIETMFIKMGKKQSSRTKNGLEMLFLQAELSWNIWIEK